MKVAVSKATLQIPPTYFAVQHAIALQERFDIRFFTSAGDIRDAQVAEGLSVHDVSRSIPLLSHCPYLLRQKAAPLLEPILARAISRWAPQVIHQHFANLSGAAVRAHRRQNVPLLLTVHGADVFVPLASQSSLRGKDRMLLGHHRRTVQRAFDEANSILAVSEYLAGRAVAAGAQARKVQVHYQGIDTRRYTPSVHRNRDELPRVVFIGALSEAKGIRDLVTASVRLETRTPHRLMLAGDGPLRGQVEDAAGMHRHIEFLGPVDRQHIRDLLDGATVLVLPAREWKGRREAAGLVTLEAQAMRVPVVAYDSGGVREMFDDGRTGLLVREGDIDALGEAVRQIIDLPAAEHESMGDRARAFVIRHRSLAVSAEELARHYEDMTR